MPDLLQVLVQVQLAGGEPFARMGGCIESRARAATSCSLRPLGLSPGLILSCVVEALITAQLGKPTVAARRRDSVLLGLLELYGCSDSFLWSATTPNYMRGYPFILMDLLFSVLRDRVTKRDFTGFKRGLRG